MIWHDMMYRGWWEMGRCGRWRLLVVVWVRGCLQGKVHHWTPPRRLPLPPHTCSLAVLPGRARLLPVETAGKTVTVAARWVVLLPAVLTDHRSAAADCTEKPFAANDASASAMHTRAILLQCVKSLFLFVCLFVIRTHLAPFVLHGIGPRPRHLSPWAPMGSLRERG